MRVFHVVLVLGALLACKNKGNEQQQQPQPAVELPPPASPPPAVVEAPAATSCARLGLYYTLGGGVQKGGVNISCDGKCNDLEEKDDGAKLKASCLVNCSAIGSARSKFAGSLNVNLDLNRSEKDPMRYSGTIGDGKSSPNPVSLTFKQKYTEANGQMTEKNMRWSMTLRPCKQ
ncbi:MAG: hypothetical protein HS104_07675 [Polyangiaceae bacterium]|nr:hypothetical protein [Polyangiaceae bacterium]MCL4749371.1 hypothetical protein [Myxococcales bacterium]